MRIVATLARATAMTGAVQLAACSVLWVEPARGRSGDAEPACTSSMSAVVADTAGFSLLFIGSMFTMIGLSVDLFGTDRLTQREALVVTAGASGALVYGLSGAYGHHEVRRCRRLQSLGSRGAE